MRSPRRVAIRCSKARWILTLSGSPRFTKPNVAWCSQRRQPATGAAAALFNRRSAVRAAAGSGPSARSRRSLRWCCASGSAWFSSSAGLPSGSSGTVAAGPAVTVGREAGRTGIVMVLTADREPADVRSCASETVTTLMSPGRRCGRHCVHGLTASVLGNSGVLRNSGVLGNSGGGRGILQRGRCSSLLRGGLFSAGAPGRPRRGLGRVRLRHGLPLSVFVFIIQRLWGRHHAVPTAFIQIPSLPARPRRFQNYGPAAEPCYSTTSSRSPP